MNRVNKSQISVYKRDEDVSKDVEMTPFVVDKKGGCK